MPDTVLFGETDDRSKENHCYPSTAFDHANLEDEHAVQALFTTTRCVFVKTHRMDCEQITSAAIASAYSGFLNSGCKGIWKWTTSGDTAVNSDPWATFSHWRWLWDFGGLFCSFCQ